MRHSLLSIVGLAVMVAMAGNAEAYCLNNCPTDDSVCDLNRESGYWLSIQMYRKYQTTVMGSTRATDEELANIDIRMATGLVLENCRPGQVLIYHNGTSSTNTERVISGLFSRFCRVADIRRENWRAPPTIGGSREVEHRLAKCEITKWDAPKAAYEEAERTQSTRSLIDAANGIGVAPPKQAASADGGGLGRAMEKHVSGSGGNADNSPPCWNAVFGQGGCPQDTKR